MTEWVGKTDSEGSWVRLDDFKTLTARLAEAERLLRDFIDWTLAPPETDSLPPDLQERLNRWMDMVIADSADVAQGLEVASDCKTCNGSLVYGTYRCPDCHRTYTSAPESPVNDMA